MTRLFFHWQAGEHTTHGYLTSLADAALFDGFTSYVSAEMPVISAGPVHVSALLALGAYPWNLCPIIDLMTVEKDGGPSGLQVGIDDNGRVRFTVVTSSGTHSLLTARTLPLRTWHVVACSFSGGEMTICIDGDITAKLAVTGALVAPLATELLIGRSRHTDIATGAIRPHAHLPTTFYYDGLIGHVTLADYPVQDITPDTSPGLTLRKLPCGPEGAGRFGATYEHLKYYEGWDRRWRVGDSPDVLVRFEHTEDRLVFWRGTNYIPCWVSSEGIWYTNEFNETWGNGATGCAEPMSDKHCAFSHVRILESTSARVRVHWRYALVDVMGVRPRKDPVTGWTDFTDELYTIYPDGTAIRDVTLHSTQPMESHEFQESIVVLGPGQRPEDVLETSPITLGNMSGATKTYSWVEGRPRHLHAPHAANIAKIHTKALRQPWFAVPTGPCESRDNGPQDHPLFPPYHHETLSPGQIFPWWNHWPTSEIPSDGRRAVAADRASHSSVISGTEWADYELTPTSRRRLMLHGLTEETVPELIPLARAWLSPAATVDVFGADEAKFDPTQKAWSMCARASTVSFTLTGSQDTPIENPCIVVQNWGEKLATVTVNSNALISSQVLLGHRHRAAGSDLIVWINYRSTSHTKLVISRN